MKTSRLLTGVPLVGFILCGIAFAEVVQKPYRCEDTPSGGCLPANPGWECVDVQGDGICDFSRYNP